MKEQFGEISQKDILGSGEKETPGLELSKTKELNDLVDRANELADDLKNDRNITVGRMERFEEAMRKLKVNFGAEGETMTIEELKRIPDIKKNTEIFNEINSGSIDRDKELTYITPGIARILVGFGVDVLYLDGLSQISDGVAEIIGNADKVVVRLHSLEVISVTQLESLCLKTKKVNLTGLKIEKISFDLARLMDSLMSKIIISEKQKQKLKELYPSLVFENIY